MDQFHDGPAHDTSMHDLYRPDRRVAGWVGAGTMAMLLAIAGLGYNALSQSRAASAQIAAADRELARLAEARTETPPGPAEGHGTGAAEPAPVTTAPAETVALARAPEPAAPAPAPEPVAAPGPGESPLPGTKPDLPRPAGRATPEPASAKPASPNAASTETALSEAEELEAIERFNAASADIQLRGREIREAYERTLAELQPGSRLIADLLDSREEITESRRRVAEARRALQTLVADRAALQDEAPDLLSEAAPDPYTSTIAVTEFYQTMLKIDPALDRHDAYHGAVFDSMDAILDICERSLGRSRVVDGVLTLPSEADAVAFRLESARINELSRRTTSVLQRLAAYAKATSDAFDRGQEPPSEPVLPWQTGDAITITRRGIRFQPESRATIDLGMPDTLEPLIGAFGRPDREEPDGDDRMHYWDELGLVARTTGARQLVWFAVSTNTFNDSGAFLPGHEFRGRLRVFGEEFGEVDTPASLNRVLGEQVFRPLSDDGALWGAQGDGFALCVPLSETGLAYGVTLHPERPETRPVKPGF